MALSEPKCKGQRQWREQSAVLIARGCVAGKIVGRGEIVAVHANYQAALGVLNACVYGEGLIVEVELCGNGRDVSGVNVEIAVEIYLGESLC